MKCEMFRRIRLFMLCINFCTVLTFGVIGCGGDTEDKKEDNFAPVIDRFIIPKEAVPGESVVFQVDAHDLDGDTLTYTWTVDGIPLDDTTPTVMWTASGLGTVELEKTLTVEVSVSDGKGTPTIGQKRLSVITLKQLWVGDWDVRSIIDEEGRDILDLTNVLYEELFAEAEVQVSFAMSMNMSQGGTVRLRHTILFEADGESTRIAGTAIGTYTVSDADYTIKWDGVIASAEDAALAEVATDFSEGLEDTFADEEHGTWNRDDDLC